MSTNRLQPKKQLGQNFLINKQAQERVIKAFSNLLEKYPNLPLVEIGPGQGDMTQLLLELEPKLLGLEIDLEAVNLLNVKFAKQIEGKKLNLVHIDALELLDGITKNETKNNFLPSNFVLFSSLPYNVGSRILVELALTYPQTPFCVIVQKEVARKCLQTQDFTFFGALLNLFWQTKIAFDIAPHNFWPQPKVWSSLLVALPLINQVNFPLFLQTQKQRIQAKETLKLLFSNPNKTLANNLKYLNWQKNEIESFLEQNNLQISTRLSWQNYKFILEAILSKDLEEKNL